MTLLYSSCSRNTRWTRVLSIKSSNRSLAAPRLDSFLNEFANTDTLKRLQRYGDLLPPHLDSRHSVEHLEPLDQDVSDAAATEYQHILRGVWLARSEREWRFFSFHLRRKLYEVLSAITRDSVLKAMEGTDAVIEGPTTNIPLPYVNQMREIPEVAFDAVIDRLNLLRSRELTKYCANRECPAPYYIARRKSQRYCGDHCAELFELEAKRNWWKEHGSDWRESRHKSNTERVKDGKKKT